jgi:hypothetical protein
MGRTAQGAEFDAILAADGFESRWCLDLTLSDGSTAYLCDAGAGVGTAPLVINGHTYLVEIEEPPEIAFSQGMMADGARWPMVIQNADGAYSVTDATGVSPLEGADFTLWYAVSRVGANTWFPDFICDGRVRNVEAKSDVAQFGLVHRMYDTQNVMSGESVTLEELSPVAGMVGEMIIGGLSNETNGLINGWRRDPYLRFEDEERLARDWRPVF